MEKTTRFDYAVGSPSCQNNYNYNIAQRNASIESANSGAFISTRDQARECLFSAPRLFGMEEGASANNSERMEARRTLYAGTSHAEPEINERAFSVPPESILMEPTTETIPQRETARYSEPSTFKHTNLMDYVEKYGNTTFLNRPKMTSFAETAAPAPSEYVDINPSASTMRYTQKTFDTNKALEILSKPAHVAVHTARVESATKVKATVEKTKLTSKSKVMVAVYAAIIVLLAVLVTTTGILLGRVNGDISSLESQLSIQSSINADKQSKLDSLSNSQAIYDKAIGSGMTEASESKSFVLVDVYDVPSYAATSNWFDKIGDWLSSIVGAN